MADEGEAFPIIGVGASAGGLEALREMFGGSEGPCGMAFVVIQHLDPTHESLMAELLQRYSELRISQVEGGEVMEPDHIYVIPPGHGLAVNDGVLELTEFTNPRGMRRPIDDFFESLAEDRQDRAACVILSGTGADGSRGLRAIKEYGGICVVQDPERAAYDGMPSSAISTGLVDIICDPRDVIEYLKSFFERGGLSSGDLSVADDVGDLIDNLCTVLREAVGHDFSRYKRSTLNRRIARRMQVLGIDDGAEYLRHLREEEDECEALFRDLLINVTRFFRDPPAFETLENGVIDGLVANARDAEEIRVWVPGCSSGEEAYSIAMMFDAASTRHGKRPYVQIFATDIDEKMLEIARSATYPLASLDDIPHRFREECVLVGSDTFTVAPKIRDLVRFSTHNVVRDPPYSKIDLISCRNLLIYFEDSLQKIVLPLFHFSLLDGGTLFLGSSEVVGRHEDLFEVVDQSARLFRRKAAKNNYSLRLADMGARPRRRKLEEPSPSRPRTNGVEISALQLVAKKYAPVSLLVDREGLLLERWGDAGRYLDFPERLERHIHVPALARPGLREIVGPLIRQVSETGRRAVAKDVSIRTGFGNLEARIICEAVSEANFLFVIEETRELQPHASDFDELDLEESQQKFLEEELQATRHRLRSTVEELETANEELKSSNEEMMSMNEELQSTNEELTTVNDELKNKVDQLTVANSDFKNFVDSTQLAVLVVDREMKLRTFTDAAQEVFPICKGDLGRALGDLPSRLDAKSYLDLARRAAIDGKESDIGLHSNALDAEFILRALPYRLLDGEIDGATLVFTDVTQALSLERDLVEERERLRLALEVANIGVWEYEPATDRTVLDATERKLLNIEASDPGDTMEPILASLPAEDRARVNRALRMAIEGRGDFDETFRIPLGDGESRWLHGLGKQIEVLGERKFIGVTFDITSEQALLDQRELMIREMNHRVKNLFSIISAMVGIASREAMDVTEFADGLRERIHALGRSHSLTNRVGDENSGGIDLAELIETVLKPNLAGQDIRMTGEPLPLSNDKITSLALVLHEWATNSTKYGALAGPDGALSISWEVVDGEVALRWSETGQGKDAGVEHEPGFGTRLVEMAARQLRGAASGSMTDEGYERKLVFPA